MTSFEARMAVLPRELEPLAGVAVSRIGPRGDGGYGVADGVLADVEWIVSLGLADDWRFESDLQTRTGADLDVYDHTVTEDFWALRAFQFTARRLRPGSSKRLSTINKETGYLRYRRFFRDPSRVHHRVRVGYPAEGNRSLTQILSSRSSAKVFLKCDIEGWEWRILDEIINNRDRMVGLAIEFHDVDLRLAGLVDFVNEMPEFVVVATNANNFGSVATDGTPEVVEVSLARRELLGASDEHRKRLPNERNSLLASPIELEFR